MEISPSIPIPDFSFKNFDTQYKSNYFFDYKWHNKRKLMIGCEYMDTTKARIQGNALVVTIPKSLGVEPGTEYRFSKESDGSLKLTPTRKVPETMTELFKGWHGKDK